MSNHEDVIADILKDFKAPGRAYSPAKRSVLFILASVFFSITLTELLGTYTVQQVLGNPEKKALYLQLISGMILLSTLSLYAFKKIIPGEIISKRHKLAIGTSTATLLTSFIYLAVNPGPEHVHPMRPSCVFEVIFVGLLTLPLILRVFKRSEFFTDKILFWSAGLISGLFPALLMQVACSHEAWHALLLHYAPVILFGLIGMTLMRKIYIQRNR